MVEEIGNAISNAIRSSLVICVGIIFVGAIIEFYALVRDFILSVFFLLALVSKCKDYDGIDYEDEL